MLTYKKLSDSSSGKDYYIMINFKTFSDLETGSLDITVLNGTNCWHMSGEWSFLCYSSRWEVQTGC